MYLVTFKPSRILLVSAANPCDQLEPVAKSVWGNLSPQKIGKAAINESAHLVTNRFRLKCKFANFQTTLYWYSVSSIYKWTMFTFSLLPGQRIPVYLSASLFDSSRTFVKTTDCTFTFLYLCPRIITENFYCTFSTHIVIMEYYGSSFLTCTWQRLASRGWTEGAPLSSYSYLTDWMAVSFKFSRVWPKTL